MFIFLFFLWLILNGKATPELIVTGIVLSALVCLFLNKTLGYTFGNDMRILRNAPLLLLYFAVLVCEIIKASLQVMWFALCTRKKPDPVLMEFHSGLKGRFQNELVANSITLTPGTYTVFLEGDRFVVHCLRKEYADNFDDLIFVRLISKLK